MRFTHIGLSLQKLTNGDVCRPSFSHPCSNLCRLTAGSASLITDDEADSNLSCDQATSGACSCLRDYLGRRTGFAT